MGFNTLQVYLSSYYVNNFNEFGRTWQVNIQADRRFREQESDILQLQVRNSHGEMIRLGTLLNVRESSGPVAVMRYNMYAANAITGNPAQGTSSGQAIDVMQDVADGTLPDSMASEWTELTYLQQQAGNEALFVFAMSVVFVFLVLAGQYESWSLPLAVILVVPMCLLCSVVGVRLLGMEVNLFTQIGFVVLVGLASKNAILIVEFAKQRQEQGAPRLDGQIGGVAVAIAADHDPVRVHPRGVPLVIATGNGRCRDAPGSRSGSVQRNAGSTLLFGIFLTPVFFYVIRRVSRVPSTKLLADAPGPRCRRDGRTRQTILTSV